MLKKLRSQMLNCLRNYSRVTNTLSVFSVKIIPTFSHLPWSQRQFGAYTFQSLAILTAKILTLSAVRNSLSVLNTLCQSFITGWFSWDPGCLFMLIILVLIFASFANMLHALPCLVECFYGPSSPSATFHLAFLTVLRPPA